MRFWEWGVADAEHADFDFIDTTHRTVFGPWGMDASDSETDAYVNNENMQFGNSGTGFVYETVLHILLTQIKAKLGQVPVLLAADWMVWAQTNAGSDAGTAVVRRMITLPDIGDSSNWRRDKSGDIDWYNDLKHMVRGQDVEDAILHSSAWTQDNSTNILNRIAIRDVVVRALRDNTDIWAHISETHTYGSMPSAGINYIGDPVSAYQYRSYIAFAYLYPIEFYKDDGTGSLDLSSPVGDNPGEEYYLGAVEPGQTGTPVKAWIRNYSDATQQVEIFDDHAEYTDPITRIGNGQLDFIELAEAAVSQKYTPTFYSATQYEVKAEAYRDNAVSLHPTINADASWRGDVSSDFTAPSGGLTIPAEAWQSAGIATSDEIEVAVTGNTTDTAWPADSNEQVEMTYDNAGSADATAWRDVTGHREKTRAQVTIDATTKLIPTRRIDPVDWPVDTKAFIQDQTKINEGEISSVQEMSVTAETFVGSGLDDATISGNFNGVWTDQLRVRIDGTGTPDTYEYSIDGGSTWEDTDVPITGSAQLLQDGLYVTFAATTGHTLTDYWWSDVVAWAITLKALTANSNVYNSGASIGTTLPLRDVTATVFTTVSQASGVSEGTPARLWVDDTTGFLATDDVFIQSPQNPDTAETIEIDSIGTGYIDLVASMTQDYVAGDFVTKVGSGEEPFWLRPVAEITTAEELKRLRLNARML